MITVVTHHNPNRKVDISRCVRSVSNALQHGDRHFFIECDGTNYADFAKTRFDALSLGEYVCFVDDDDYIPSNALETVRKCIVDNPSVGLYFTRECKAHGNDIIHCKAGEKYENLVVSPTSIHNLCVFNTKYMIDEPLNVALQAQCGIEWAIKAWLGLYHGAVHIPIDGYYYCLHKNQLSQNMTKNFFNNYSFFKGVFAGWQKHCGQIPLYTLPE